MCQECFDILMQSYQEVLCYTFGVTAIATTLSNCRYKALAIHLPLGDAC
ncbi:hypothetical protein [Nostoc sp. 'Peltigera membranacea cyanobiont' 213]|nr:hypothetical protein [Nostoc sp. 'Peltigera membranacea cyanobiont' 213]